MGIVIVLGWESGLVFRGVYYPVAVGRGSVSCERFAGGRSKTKNGRRRIRSYFSPRWSLLSCVWIVYIDRRWYPLTWKRMHASTWLVILVLFIEMDIHCSDW